jgi:hypothetical protein
VEGIEGMNAKISKPRSLKPSIKRLIFTRAVTDRKVPREFLANQLIKEITEIGEIPPSIETAKRYISAARNTDNPIDKPWSLGAYRDYPQYLPISSISFLMDYLRIEGHIDGYGEDDHNHYFSIRKAIWMLRLEPIIKKRIHTNNDDISISVISSIYSSAELASETMGEDKFDSSELDAFLCCGNLDGLLQYDPEAKKKHAKMVDSHPIELKENDK